MSKQIKVSDEVHQRLMGAKKDTETVSDLISRLLGGASAVQTDEADTLLEQLDKQYTDPYVELRQNLDDDELPECCQGIFTGLAKDRCEHWEWVNGGWKNKVTGKYANDPVYYHYL